MKTAGNTYKIKFSTLFQPVGLYFCLYLLTVVLLSGCRNNHHTSDHGENIDTLKVVTLYGPTSYFNYRGEIMGIDYENIKKFSKDEGMVLEINTVRNIPELIESLREGRAHLAAYPVPLISEYNEDLIYCGPLEITNQVLVQKNGNSKLSDVTALVGKEVAVEKNSKYQYRLENLNEEIGGGIIIDSIENDTITSEDLMSMVNRGEIDYAIVDSEIARLYGGAFPNLDTSLRLSADQAASWVVAPGLDSLASRIERWENMTHSSEFIRGIYKRYYDNALNDDYDTNLSYFKKLDLKKGRPVSSYDDIFRRHASTTNYDWRLLAAIAFCESRFNPSIASRFGAFGLMQVMPSTAQAMGVDPSSLGNPDNNVMAAARIINRLDRTLKEKVPDEDERMKFVIAGYNSGLGHIYDAMALAEKIGLDPQKWTGNVSIAALMKSRPEYYNDPVVKHGYFRGRETVDFVDNVSGIYNYLLQSMPHK